MSDGDTWFNDQGFVDMEVLDHESDRGAALLVGAVVETQLERLLRKVFRDVRKSKKSDPVRELLRDGGVLGSFRAKTDLAYAMGLFNESMYWDLHYIRKIRNEFAHQYAQTSFEQERVRQWLDEMPIKKFQRGRVKKYCFQTKTWVEVENPSSRLLFNMSAMTISDALKHITEHAPECPAPMPHPVYEKQP